MALPTRWLLVLRLAWNFFGAFIAIFLALYLVGPSVNPFVLASLGGTTVFLFRLTRAPAAQPRALLGGHLGGAAIGIASYQTLGNELWVYATAQAFTVLWMLATRSVHPPAGANPIIMVYAGATWSSLWQPVLVGALALMAVAMVWSRCFKGTHRYPVSLWEPSPPTSLWGVWYE